MESLEHTSGCGSSGILLFSRHFFLFLCILHPPIFPYFYYFYLSLSLTLLCLRWAWKCDQGMKSVGWWSGGKMLHVIAGGGGILVADVCNNKRRKFNALFSLRWESYCFLVEVWGCFCLFIGSCLVGLWDDVLGKFGVESFYAEK